MGGQVRRLGIPEENIDGLFRGDLAFLTGLPDDTTVIDCYKNKSKQVFYFLLESEEFENVPEGSVIPTVTKCPVGYRPYDVDVEEV